MSWICGHAKLVNNDNFGQIWGAVCIKLKIILNFLHIFNKAFKTGPLKSSKISPDIENFQNCNFQRWSAFGGSRPASQNVRKNAAPMKVLHESEWGAIIRIKKDDPTSWLLLICELGLRDSRQQRILLYYISVVNSLSETDSWVKKSVAHKHC